MRIGILTGGGDVPGLNACIRAVALGADDRGWTAIGIRRGWQGLLDIDPDDYVSVANGTIELTRERVRGIDRFGGTILHTSRCDPRTTRDGDRTTHVLGVLEKLGIDALVTLGGDGTLKFSAHLASLGVPVIAVPKTMDNDVAGTDYCIGFSTAVTRSVTAINALRTTTESHERIAVVELFGRRCGETALLAGFLAQADRTAIAEVPVELDVLLPLLARDRATNPAHYGVLVVAEGATIAGEAEIDLSGSATHRTAEGIGHRLARAIEAAGNATVVQELAYLMRSGEPDALDRMVGLAFGGLAVQLIARGETACLVALRDGNYCRIGIDAVLAPSKRVDVDRLYDRASYRAQLREIEGLPMFLY